MRGRRRSVLDNYVLAPDGRTPVIERDTLKWAAWFESADRIVRQDKIGDYVVSTVFLGIDHNWMRRGGPVLWETMVFGGWRWRDDLQQRRYDSYDKAVEGHMRILELVKMAATS